MRLRLSLLLGAFFDVIGDIADGLQFLCVLIRDFDGKFFFKGHDQLDGVEGILMRQGGEQSVVISVELLRRSVSIRVEGYDIELVS